jgi:hypothetical protein
MKFGWLLGLAVRVSLVSFDNANERRVTWQAGAA